MNSKRTTGNGTPAGAAACWLASLALFSSTLPSRAQTCTVDWNDVHQRIDGFGASCAFSGRTWANYTAQIFFSTNLNVVYSDKLGNTYTNNGLGLSLLRNRIQTNGTASASELSLITNVPALGVTVWSTPWSPPGGYKTTSSADGGSFQGGAATNQAYATQLANYVLNMKTNYGVNLYAISVQNEPDNITTSTESCGWTAQQIHDFVPYLYTNLTNNPYGVSSTRIMIPESENWGGAKTNLYTNAMNDASVAAQVGIIANHDYVPNNVAGDTNPPAVLPTYGKTLWETEVSTIRDTADASITNAMYVAGRIHMFLTGPQVNAWHYWWLISGNPDNEGLMLTNDLPTRRMFVVGQFSRFVRPGYYRIGATNTGAAFISAYRETNSGMFAIVAINTNDATAITNTFSLTNFSARSVTPWLTTSNLSLASQTPTNFSGASFTYTLPAMSVVTFVGQASNSPPTLTPVASRTINAGFPLQVTNLATDPDLPSQNLTFTLLSGPTGATLTPLDATNAVFAWRPLVSQANSTNPVGVVVADSGWPIRSATNNFTVTVNPLTNPVIGSVTVTGGQVSLGVTNWGLQGPDYTLLTATNLLGDWQTLYTLGSTNSAVTEMMDTNPTGPVRFYRIQIGP